MESYKIAIVDKINDALKASKRSDTFLSVSCVYRCINSLVDITFDKKQLAFIVDMLVDEGILVYSRSRHSLCLEEGYRYDFNVRETISAKSYAQWLSYHADSLYSRLYGPMTPEQKVEFYNQNYVTMYNINVRVPASMMYPDAETLDDIPPVAFNVMESDFYHASNQYDEDCGYL